MKSHFYILKFKNIIIFSIALIIILISFSMFFHVSSVGSKVQISNDGVRVPIIMYHSILKDKSKSGKYVITPSQLESDLIYIKENNYTTILVSDLISYVYNNGTLPEKPIVLSFDDGYYNNYTYLFPLLQKYNMKAVISIVGTYTNTYSMKDIANPNYGYLRWKDIKELYDSELFEFANHTYELHKCKNGRNGCKKKFGESIDSFGINYINKNPECLYSLKRNNRSFEYSSEKFFERYVESD